mgnify:FL=1
MRVKNKQTMRALARGSLRQNRSRNVMAILAIALTAMLFTAVFTVSSSMMDTLQQATMRQVGTSAHGGFKFLTQEQYDTLKEDKKLVDLSYNIIIGFGENPELNKTYTEIRWTEEKAARWGFSYPTTGRLPESGLEACASTAVLDALGVPHEIGAQLPLQFTARGVTYHETFTLCGFYEADVALAANEVYLSREYCERVAPPLTVPLYELGTSDPSFMAGSLNPSFFFSTSWNIGAQVDALMQRCGFDPQLVNSGVNWAYMSAEIDAASLLLIAGVLALVLLSGTLIIYNIFYLSVSRDIRFYGLLKTVGTTSRQLRSLVHRQALLLCVFGIPLGLAAGYACGAFLVPAVMGASTFSENFSLSASPVIFVGGALFALLTVWVSCIRPCRLAAKVSPIEAVRHTGVSSVPGASKKTGKLTPWSMAVAGLRRDRRKTLLVVLSLTLSMVLLNGTYTMVTGFDMDKYLSNRVVSDFIISDVSVRGVSPGTAVLDGVTDAALEQIKALPGLEGMGSVYMREAVHHLSDKAYQNGLSILEDYGFELPMPYAEGVVEEMKELRNMPSHIYGVDAFAAERMELSGGTLDKEKFESGDYAVVSAFYTSGEGRYYDIGDMLPVDFGNGVVKEYEVLAIGSPAYAMGPQHGHLLDLYVTLPTSEYLAQVGPADPLCTAFDVDDAHIPEVETWIADYCENVEPSLAYESRAVYVESFESTQSMYTVVGGTLSFLLALIGVLNFTGAIVTSLLTRRRELAMLQSVGMTGRQLRQMLVCEGLLYALLTLAVTVSLGSALCYGGILLFSQSMWFFTYHFTLLPVLLCAPPLLLVTALIPLFGYRSISRNSLVERLREVE